MISSSPAREAASAEPRRPIALRLRPRLAILFAALALSACAGDEKDGDFPAVEFAAPETVVEYEVEVVGAPKDAIGDILEETLSLYRRQDDGAPSIQILRRRAEQDIEPAQKVLKAYGFYEAAVSVEVVELPPEGSDPEAKPEADPTHSEAERAEGGKADEASYELFGANGLFSGGDGSAAAPPQEGEEGSGEPQTRERALARVIVEPGRPFILKRQELRLVRVPEGPPITLPPAESLGSPINARADAAGILLAESQAVAWLRANGRPWAEVRGRRAEIDPPNATMDVVSRISPGPYAAYGGLEVEGREQVAAEHIASYKPWKPGEAVDRRQLRDYQSELMETELFDSVIVDVPSATPAEGAPAEVPITVTVEEAKARTVTAGVRWNSDTGPAARAGFIHRNLFNHGERFEVTGEVGAERQALLFEARKPQFGRDGQDLTGSLEARHEEQDAYDETAVTLLVGVERELDRYWTVGVGGLVEVSEIVDNGVTQDVFLYGVPAFVRYDGSDDLLNPTEGIRAHLSATPFNGTVDSRNVFFLQTELQTSGYLPLDDSKRFVLAGRARLGSTFADQLADVPASHRYYSGGGGSIRGYSQDSIGALDSSNDPIGGLSVAEVGAELRARIQGDIGAALFVEAGSVSNTVAPTFENGVQYAAGAGLRYYSPVGPIRFDVGVPLNPRDTDDAFGIYFSIGQAY